MMVEDELSCPGMTARLVRFDIRSRASSVLRDDDRYLIDMCLTPRPLDARGGYRQRWGPHRLERLGDIFMIPPGEELFAMGGSNLQSSLICLVDAATIHEVAGRKLAWSDRQLATALDIGSARIRALLLRLTEEVRYPGLGASQMAGFLAGELAVELARFGLEVAEPRVTGGLSGWRLRLIDERLADDPRAPDLKELAGLCGISIRQLTRGFRASRGCTIGDYVEQRRMERAKRLLMSDKSVKMIAFTLGYSSPSAFTFAFRRAVGVNPTLFRQRQARTRTASQSLA
jgi:AraC family transcriptional regulator